MVQVPFKTFHVQTHLILTRTLLFFHLAGEMMRKLRHREDELLAHDHKTSKWQSWDLNAGILSLDYTCTEAFSHMPSHVPPCTYLVLSPLSHGRKPGPEYLSVLSLPMSCLYTH